MAEIGLGITLLSLIIWLVLLFGRGQFWRSDQFLKAEGERIKAKNDSIYPLAFSPYPFICAIIPARNEADLLPVTLRSLLTQTYLNLQIVLVDDHSTDGTADVAQQTAQTL